MYTYNIKEKVQTQTQPRIYGEHTIIFKSVGTDAQKHITLN